MTVGRLLAGAVEAACLGLAVVLVADVAVGVFSRYVLQNTFQWYDEIARLCFVWMIFLGAVVAVQRGAHFRLHLVVDRLGPRGRRAADVAVRPLTRSTNGRAWDRHALRRGFLDKQDKNSPVSLGDC